jgi:glycopeptide antibiotics resistance protein
MLAAASCIAILLVTLTPGDPITGHHVNLTPFVTIRSYLQPTFDVDLAARQLGGNILLFAPTGLLLVWSGLRIGRAVAVAAALSTIIEFAQLVVVTSRVADVDDIILNVIGGGLGACVGWSILVAVRSLRRSFEQ